MLVGRSVLISLETEQVCVHPLPYRPVGIVVERVHVHRAEAVLDGVGVPPLPHGGGTLEDRVEPGRAVLLLEEGESDIIPAGVREGGIEIRGADESRGELVAVVADVLDKIRHGLVLDGITKKTEAQRQGIRGLGVNRDKFSLFRCI